MREWLFRPWRAINSTNTRFKIKTNTTNTNFILTGLHHYRPCRTFSTAAAEPTKTPTHERVEVRCGSAGTVSIDLVNVNQETSNSPLFLLFPPVPISDGSLSPIPRFLDGQPVAVINYRWGPVRAEGDDDSRLRVSFVSPTPVHDSAFAYSWIAKKFQPDKYVRRDVYIYGSHLGASLATSLALTSSHPHMQLAVRGVVTYNGIYDWTMFLPDHPISQGPKKKPWPAPKAMEGSHIHRLSEGLRTLFRRPTDMFDPFVSPSLFFHSPGLLIPETFTISALETTALDALTAMIKPGDAADALPVSPPKPPRKSRMIFPPRTSTLKLPETLLLYDSPAPKLGGSTRSAIVRGNTFENQALELTEKLQRSIMNDMTTRSKWDDDVDYMEKEPTRRVQLRDVGQERGAMELPDEAEDQVLDWLRDRTSMFNAR